LFFSKGKAISKYKDRLYFLVNSKIAFAAWCRAGKKTKVCTDLSTTALPTLTSLAAD
jgi:hypothetical protein